MAAQCVVLLRAEFQQVLAVVDDLAAEFRSLGKQAHNGHGGDGFTAPGFTHQAHGFPGANGEVDVINNLHVAVGIGELDGEVADLNEIVVGTVEHKASIAVLLSFGQCRQGFVE